MSVKFDVSVYPIGTIVGIFENIQIEDAIDFNTAIDELYRKLKHKYDKHEFIIRSFSLY